MMSQEPLRILLVGQNLNDLEVLEELTRDSRAYEARLQTTQDPAEVWGRVVEEDFDIVFFCDPEASSQGGLEAIRHLRRMAPALPVVAITDSDDRHGAVELMKAGATDCLARASVSADSLERTVHHALDQCRAERDRLRAEAQLRHSEERYRTTLDALGDALHVVGSDMRVVLANEAFRKWIAQFGLSTEVEGRTPQDILPFLPERVLDEYRQVFDTGRMLVTREEADVAGHRVFTETRKIPVWADNHVESVITTIRDITESRVQEERLRESEQRYRELVENANSIIMRRDTEGRVTFFNEFAQRFFGWPEQDILGKNVVGTIIPPVDSTGRDMAAMVRDITSHPERYATNENENVRRNGERVWVSWTNQAIRDAEGRIAEILCVGQDVTERKRTERALLVSERRYRNLVQHANSAIILVDPKGSILFMNRFAERLFGFTQEEVIGRNLVGTVVEEDADCMIGPVLQDTRDSRPHECINVTKDGRRLTITWVNWPVTDADGRLVHIVCFGHDITESKQAELELQRERQFSNAVIETAGALIIVLDTNGRILRFNKACQRATGYSFEEVKGRDFMSLLVPPDKRDEVQAVIDVLLGDKTYTAHENAWLTKAGETRTIAWHNTRVLAEDGTVHYIIGTGIDVTEQRELAEHLQRAAKLEAVGQLAGGVAHDFNNLLTAILGYVDLNLPQIPRDSQMHEDMLQVRTAAKQAAELTQQLLAFGREQRIAPEVLDLNYVVPGVQSMLRRLIEEHIEVRIVLSGSPLMVKADQTQIAQVLMNLAVNARDAMPNGGRLTVETGLVRMASEYGATSAGVTPGPYAVLKVSDTGVGMSPEVQEKMFDPFFTTKEVGRGTGLGLSTVYDIVQQHEGSIHCDSDVGKGTTFTVLLPLVQTEETTTHEPSDFSVLPTGAHTILVVEDESEVRNLVVNTLQTCGYSVLAADNGRDALRLAREHTGDIHLLLTDVVMPRMSGPELAQKLRLIRPDVKLVFMSGYPMGAGGGLPGVDMLQKPFTLRRLARKLFEVLSRE